MFWDLERDDFHHFKLTRWNFGKIISFFYSILGRFLSRIPTRNSMILGIKSFLLVPRQISNIVYLVPLIFRRFSLKYLHIFQSDWIDSGLNLNLTLKQTKRVKIPTKRNILSRKITQGSLINITAVDATINKKQARHAQPARKLKYRNWVFGTKSNI